MKKITISSEKIKWFALLSMTADHIDKIFTHTTWISATLGRMAFPIFSWLLISNFCTYHQPQKYLLRLSFFGLLSQLILLFYGIPFSNILFLFLCAILFLTIVEKACQMTKSFFIQAYFSLLFFSFLILAITKTDYSFFGFLFLIALYAYQKKNTKLNSFAVLLLSIMINCQSFVAAFFSFATTLALLFFIKIKNSPRLTKWWFFYLYYPLHQMLLYSLKIWLGI